MTAIEVSGVEKSFRIPTHRIDSFKERATHPFAKAEYRELRALRDVSFEVSAGEFFGIVGRNGSGKSTLLKILAGIYAADAGTIRMAGRLAPFIELGVGFDPELTARENGVLNGVLMGLTKREARARLDAVLEFAELEDFLELKLKNYSSGMMVRLAFAVMVQADADIMLIDEVLAVGDAAFAQKCMEVFEERRRAGRTILLVTHDMGTVESLCDRAMLLHEGRQEYVGDPVETALRYYRLNFDREQADGRSAVPDFNAEVVSARLTDGRGGDVREIAQDQPLQLDVLIEARRELEDPGFIVQLMNAHGQIVVGFRRELTGNGSVRVAPGERMRLRGSIENRLVPGRYSVDCWVRRSAGGEEMAVQGLRLFEFDVRGHTDETGVVAASSDLRASVERS